MRRLLLVIPLLLTACSFTPAITPVDLDGAEPVTLASSGDTLLIGTTRSGSPGLTRVVAGQPTPAEAAPSSPYGRDGRWTALAATTDQVTGIAGVRGGAHGNVRWSVWQGTPERITEQQQPFETFGGQDMGQLVAVAIDRQGPVMVGSWKSDSQGNEPALWRPEGDRWVRQPTPAPLKNTALTLRTVSAAAVIQGRLVLVGSEITLGEPPVVSAQVWIDGGQAWESRDLPAASPTRAEVVSCDQSCLILGQTQDRWTAWTLSGSLGVTPLTLDVEATGRPVAATQGDHSAALFPTASGTVLTTLIGTRLVAQPGPSGVPESLAISQGQLWAITSDPHGDATLWRWTPEG